MVNLEKNFNDSLNEIVSGDFDAYLKFLKFASSGTLYRYNFHNQVLIYHIRPESSVVVPYESWRSVGRKPHFKTGIHINLDENFGNIKFNGCVFALEDTYGQPFGGVWKADSDSLEYVAKMFKREENFKTSINNLTRTYVRNIIPVGSDEEFQFIYEATLFAIYNRCDLSFTFSEVSKGFYNNMSVEERKDFLSQSQYFIQNISCKTIKFIDHYIREYRKENSYERTRVNSNGFKNLADAGRTGNEISNARRRSEESNVSGRDNSQDRTDGSRSDDISGRNDSNTVSGLVSNRENVSIRTEQSRGSERTKNDNRDSSVQEVSEGTSTGNRYDADAGENGRKADSNGNSERRSTVQASEADGQLSLFDIADTESDISDDTAIIDELNEELEKTFETESIAVSKYNYVSPKLEKVVPHEYVLEVLTKGTGFVGGKVRVFNFYYERKLSKAERVKAIKESYGEGGAGWPLDGYGLHGYDTFTSKGIRFTWRDEEGEKEGYLSWSEVEKEIESLVLAGKYHISHSAKIADSSVTGMSDIEHNLLASNFADRISKRNYLLDILTDNTLSSEEKINGLVSLDNWILFDENSLIKNSVDFDNKCIKLTYPAPLATLNDSEIPFDTLLSAVDNILNTEEYKEVIAQTRDNLNNSDIEHDSEALEGSFTNALRIFCEDCSVFSNYHAIIKDLLLNDNISIDNKVKYIKSIIPNNSTVFGNNLYGLVEYKLLSDYIEVSYKNKNYERLNNSISYQELIGDFAIFVQSDNFVDRELSELKEEKSLPNILSDAISEYQNFLDNLSDNDSKVKVAVESSEDFADPEVNFTTYHYPDGREGVRYRLVTINSEGVIVPYLNRNRFFIDKEACDEYIDVHQKELDVINYDNLVYEAAFIKSAVVKEDNKVVDNDISDKYEITYTVAECSEFHVMGEFYENITSTNDAVKLFEKIPPERLNGVKAIGINVHKKGTESYEDSQFDFAFSGLIDIEDLEYISDIRNNAAAIAGIKKVMDLMPDCEIRGTLPDFELDTDSKTIAENTADVITADIEDKFSIGEYDIKVGDTINIDGTDFIVNEIGYSDVRLQDPSLVYPIIRVESKEHLNWMISMGQASIVINSTAEVVNHDVNDIKESSVDSDVTVKEKGVAVKYSYPTDWQPNMGSDSERFAKNIEAIKTLKLIESENRYATPEEQAILSQYVGWGGLSNYFDESKKPDEYKQLQELLTEDEFVSARSSTTDAFYTPKPVIDAIYDALQKMGFEKGNILEPSCGIGNFISAMPGQMRDKSHIYAVELDSLSGRITKLLHPDVNMNIQGFESVNLSDNFFDVVVGNIPFGDFKVSDSRYNKNNFLIHDYFIAKCLDKVAVGGIVALVTSKGTLDKSNSKVRRYIAERADLLGAIRLPSDTFKASANTEATSDILFFQKKAAPTLANDELNWLSLGNTEDDVVVNQYYLDNPIMCLGKMIKDTKRFGEDRAITSCVNDNRDVDLSVKLTAAVNALPAGVLSVIDRDTEEETPDIKTIEADPTVKNNTYTICDGEVYLRVNSLMYLQKDAMNNTAYERVKGLCGIRTIFHRYMDDQMNQEDDSVIAKDQADLNKAYDDFIDKYGYINSKANQLAFGEDVEYPLLCSLEREEKEEYVKADVFYKQTIRPVTKIENVSNATDALYVSLNEFNSVNIEKMLELYNVSFDELIEELKGQIYRNPVKVIDDEPYSGWESAEEYLSGNVREKLRIAESANEFNPVYGDNIEALGKIIPKDLLPSEINVGFGMSWIDTEDYEKFMYEIFNIPSWQQRTYKLSFEPNSHSYFISHKRNFISNEFVNNVYGTSRMNAFDIIEDLCNLKQIEVRDKIEDKYVLNTKETLLAREKADVIKEKFRTWFWTDGERYEKYIRRYNDTFNSNVLRSYDGSYMTFPGMNAMINLKDYQKSAVARIIRKGNTLLAHCVGAGKSFEMAAACMELRRLGLSNKPLIVVPNHLTNQMANEFMTLYPNANILLTTKKDFEKNRRRRFISKIATGDYDAVIIGASQFEKIPISKERQEVYIRSEIKDCLDAIAAIKSENGDNWSIKQIESTKKSLEAKMDKLANEEYKDDVITFEELGVDSIFVDEAHNYKNLSFNTKISRVAGINPNGSNKATDMYLKTRYIQELNPGKNVIFATGTPISNSMCEMFTMQKYMQYDTLKELGINHFDAWAANFGQIVTAMELAPEGQTYRERTRFSKFVNLPELIGLYKEFADVQMPDMLDLAIPKLKDNQFTIVESEPDSITKTYMESICERAEAIRNHSVDPSIDNMLKICNDGRLVAADTRLVNPDNETYEGSKIMKCVDNIVEKYHKSQDILGTQIVFSDIGTPNMKWSEDWETKWKNKSDTSDKNQFDLYNCIKTELVKRGIPEEEICYIHDANTDVQKAKMFADMNNGNKRIIFGSTGKMGTGTNIQKRCVAMHELDVPWRPSDVEQRDGRILRQGNINEEVEIFRYVTKGTFDAYNWNIIVNKQKFISQVMTSKDVARECDDIDDTVMSYAEVMAAASGNPYIKELNEVEMELKKLNTYKRSYDDNHINMSIKLEKLPKKIKVAIGNVNNVSNDIEKRNIYINNHLDEDNKFIFSMNIEDKSFTDKEEANKYITFLCDKLPIGKSFNGSYCGFNFEIKKDVEDFTKSCLFVTIKGERAYTRPLGINNVLIIHNAILSMDDLKKHLESVVEQEKKNFETIKEELQKPFEHEERLSQLTVRKRELTELLKEDKSKDSSNETQNSQEQELVSDDLNLSHQRKM